MFWLSPEHGLEAHATPSPRLRTLGSAVANCLLLVSVATAAPTIEFTTVRHAYVRGEEAVVKARVAGVPEGAVVRFDAGGWLPAEIAATADAAYTLDTSLLRAGDYDVHARLLHGGRELAAAVFPLSVGPERNPQRYPVYRWHMIPHEDFGWWQARGFNGFVGGSSQERQTGQSDADIRAMFDESARWGFDAGSYIHPLQSQRWIGVPEVLAQPLPDRGSELGRGKPYPRHPEVVAHAEALAWSWLDRFGDYPTWRHALLTTEFDLRSNFSPLARRLAQEEAGVDLEEVASLDNLPPEHRPQNGLIEDDNPRLRYLRWWWHTGLGDALVNERMSDVIKTKRPDLLTWHDPYRLAAVRGASRGLDAISTWTYCHPDTRRMLYTAALQAAARAEGQKVMQSITLYLYGRFVVPLGGATAVLGDDYAGRDPFYTAGPDFARETTWLAFSQRPDLLCYYNHSSHSPYLPGLDPDIASPETFDAIGETVHELVEPYGPMVLAARRPPAEVAVLMSAVAEWFGGMPKHVGYPNEQFLPYCALLAMNHVPFEVLLDDDILEGALDRYSTLVLPRAGVLTRGMHAAIQAFLQRGGKVIADSSLRATLPGAIITRYDFTSQNLLDGRALAEGRAITAEEDRATQEGYAADLKQHLAHLAPPATASSPRVVINTLEAGAATLLFLVNADKTYGPRFGEHRLHMEEGVRLTTEVRVPVTGRPALYDALARKPISYRLEDGQAVFSIELPAARGRLVAVYPEEVGTPQIDLTAEVEPGQVAPIRVTVPGASGRPLAVAHPLHVEMIDPQGRRSEYTRFAACADGEYTLPFRPALNDPPGTWTVRITELIAGQSAEATFLR